MVVIRPIDLLRHLNKQCTFVRQRPINNIMRRWFCRKILLQIHNIQSTQSIEEKTGKIISEERAKSHENFSYSLRWVTIVDRTYIFLSGSNATTDRHPNPLPREHTDMMQILHSFSVFFHFGLLFRCFSNLLVAIFHVQCYGCRLHKTRSTMSTGRDRIYLDYMARLYE